MKTAKRVGLAVLSLSTILVLWGVLIEPRLIDEVSAELAIPGLPAAWEGAQIALIADLQLGMWLGNEDTSKRIIRQLVKDQPAAVFIAGDFIYHPTEDDSVKEAREELDADERREARELILRAANLVAPLAVAGIPTYAVLGNHDYAMAHEKSFKLAWAAEQLTEALSGKGIRVLRNESALLTPPQGGSETATESLYVVGIGPRYPHEDDVEKAFSSIPPAAPRIVIMHNPRSFLKIAAGQAPLALAAHTHGGQIRLPFLPQWTWMELPRDGKVVADGWIRDYGETDNRLYVNRGIGFSLLPVRINCRPEVTLFTLHRD